MWEVFDLEVTSKCVCHGWWFHIGPKARVLSVALVAAF
jgi:hypothetical protein